MRPPMLTTGLLILGCCIKLTLCEVEDGSLEEESDRTTTAQLMIVEEPRNADVLAGDSLVLRCQAFGIPVPTISWLHDGKPIRMGRRSTTDDQEEDEDGLSEERRRNRGLHTFRMSTTGGALRIRCADAGSSGVYTCVARNAGGEAVMANASVRVTEEGNSLWRSEKCQRKRHSDESALLGTPAEIYMWTESRMERPEVAVQLICRAKGFPKPKIAWYETTDETRRLIGHDDDRFELQPNGDLVVKRMPLGATSPMNMFHCEASNQLGKSDVTIMLLELLDDPTTSTTTVRTAEKKRSYEGEEEMYS